MRQVRIEKYKPTFKPFFKSLNQRWIEAYFKMEEADHIALNDPEGKVLSNGGEILFALVDEAVVGVCALVKLDASIPYDFELSKMGVDPAYQGLGIGYKLGQAIVDLATELGGKTLYIESNTILTPAMHLYEKLGFKEIEGKNSPYARCNIYFLKYLSKSK